jgi:hypothetical protein
MSAASFAAAQAAQAARQRQLREEERMTPYTHDELDNNWEFKIVRATTRAFRNPEALRKLIDEEARSGWVMLEKFDDSRVRFKRPRSAGAQDAQQLSSGIDPYRTQYGMSPNRFTAIILLVILGISLLVVLGIVAAVNVLSHPVR